MKTLGVGIIGCGGVGNRRASHLAGARLVACADPLPGAAAKLAADHAGCTAGLDWKDVVERKDVDLVIVATPHDQLALIAASAAAAGKHVLVEKPGGRHPAELDPVIAAAGRTHVQVRVGFNLRYHRGFRRARRIVDDGGLGDLMFLRARYGHGGRLGYEQEWRADPARAGGGELIDQGVHLIDLARWFLGELPGVTGYTPTYYWKMPVDDNAFLLLRAAGGQAAFLHASCTEWKNLFSFELYGRTGKLVVEGLGGSYGPERLTWYRMKPEMGPPDTEVEDYPGPDDSWSVEFAEFLEDIRLKRPPAAGLPEAQAALTVVETVYAAGRSSQQEPRQARDAEQLGLRAPRGPL